MAEKFPKKVNKLWFSFIPRINFSPFTKDFRGGEQQNESIDQFFVTLPTAGFFSTNIKFKTINYCYSYSVSSLQDMARYYDMLFCSHEKCVLLCVDQVTLAFSL